MNVGLITFHRSHNNGAVLQAYALQNIIRAIGCTVKVIDYYPPAIKQNNNIFRPGFMPRTILRNLYALTKYRTLKYFSNLFDEFVRQKFSLTARQYVTSTELYKDPPKFDAYVCGSDQIWNPQRDAETGKPYFLNFAPSGTRRIAYAPSFGVDEIPLSRQEEIAQSINGIDFLSAREIQGQVIIKQLVGRDATLVLDPTLLISTEKWRTIANPLKIEKPYLLVYGVMSEQLAKLVAKVRQATGLKIAVIYPALQPIPIPDVDYTLCEVGPTEFLWLFQEAAVTVVNTFHGTAFSIINRKPFLVTLASNPSRIISLLDILGLSMHLVSNIDRTEGTEIMELMNSNVDELSSRLEHHQQNSLTFLKSALAA